jgi:hypothetical protein
MHDRGATKVLQGATPGRGSVVCGRWSVISGPVIGEGLIHWRNFGLTLRDPAMEEAGWRFLPELIRICFSRAQLYWALRG